MADLRSHVRQRLRMDVLRENLGDLYAVREESFDASINTKSSVSIGGQVYPAAVTGAVGAKVEVVNSGRPGKALYVPRNGGGVVSVGGGGGGGGGGTPGPGGATYIAGDGIDIISDVISTKQKLSGGLDADNFGLYVTRQTNSGLTLTADGLGVGEGDGIKVLGTLVSVDSTEIVDTAKGLSVVANSIGINPATDGGIKFISGGVAVDEAEDFTWTGTHTFQSPVQVQTNLNFIAADRKITSGANIDLTIDLGVSPNYGDLILATPLTFRSTDAQDTIPIFGFDFSLNSGSHRQLTINTIKADSIHTRIFVADGVRVDVGEEYWGKSMAYVYRDFVTPSVVGGTVPVYFEDSPAFSGALFTEGDWIMIQTINAGAGFDSAYIWGQVTGYAHQGNDTTPGGNNQPYQRWTFTLRDGEITYPVRRGNLAIDLGAEGQGYVHLSTLQSAQGPWFRIGQWYGANPYGSTAGEPNMKIGTQIGRLSGVNDALLNPTGYGLYSDNAYLHGILRTAETVVSDAGLSFQIAVINGVSSSIDEFSRIGWYTDVNDALDIETGFTPEIEIAGWVDDIQLFVKPVFRRLDIRVRDWLVDGAAISLVAGSRIDIDSSSGIRLGGFTVAADSIVPEVDLAWNLGTSSLRWKTLYVDQIVVSGSVSGDSIGGQTWTYPGDMTIDAHGGGTTTVSVVNTLVGGTANLAVEGDILVGGLVDGVNISDHAASSLHHVPATAGDGLAISGQELRVATGLAGAGLVYTSPGVMAVGPGAGFAVTPDTIEFASGFDGLGLTLSGGVLNVGAREGIGVDGLDVYLLPSVAGNGLAMTVAGRVDVKPGPGLLASADLLYFDPLFPGDGLVLTGVTLHIVPGPGLAVTASGVTFDAAFAGNGLLMSGVSLHVRPGSAITATGGTGDSVDVLLAANSGLVTASGLAIAPSLAGDGLLLTDGELNLRVSNGLEIVSDLLRVNQAYAFAWAGVTHSWSATTAATFNGNVVLNANGTFNTGIFRFNTDLQLNANLDFIGERIITSPAGLDVSMLPGGDLVLSPVGKYVYPEGNVKTNLGGYNRRWSTIYASELYIESLVASKVMSTIGGRVMVTNTNVTAGSDMTAGQLTIDLKYLDPGFVNGTYVILEDFVNGVPWFEAIKLTSAGALTGGVYRYSCLRNQKVGGTARAWPVGTAVASLGNAQGDGYIDLSAVQTVHDQAGPNMTVYVRKGGTQSWNNVAPVVTMGNLAGFAGAQSTSYGFAAGNDLTLTPATLFSGVVVDATKGLRLINTPIEIWEANNKVIRLDKVIGLAFEENNLVSSSANIAWYSELSAIDLDPTAASPIGSISFGTPLSSATNGLFIKSSRGIELIVGGFSQVMTSSGALLEYNGSADTRLQFRRGSQDYVMGVDYSLSDSFSIAPGTDLSSTLGLTLLPSGNVLIGATADSSPLSRLYVAKPVNNIVAAQRGATISITTGGANSAATITGLYVNTFPGGSSVALVEEVGIDVSLRGVQSTGRPRALRANQGDVEVLAGWLGVGIAPTMPLHVVGTSVFTDNMWVGAAADTTPPSRLYVYKNTANITASNQRAMTISHLASGATGTPFITALYISSFPGGAGVGNIQEIGIDISLRGVQTTGRPVALHADFGDLLLDSGRIGMGVAPISVVDVGAGDLGFLSSASGNNIIQGGSVGGDWLFRSRFDRILFQGGVNDANRRRMRFRMGDTLYAMVIETNGRVGVGADFTATHPLHVYNNDALIANAGLMIQQAGAGDARIQFTQQTTNWAIGIDGSIGDSFSISPSTDLSAATGVTIETTGNIGINNTNPGTLLHIGTATPTPNANPGIWITPGTASAGLSMANSGGTQMGLFAHSSGNGYVGTWSNHPFAIRANNADRILFTPGGAAAITGAVTISTTLVVTGDTTVSTGDLKVTAGWIGVGVTATAPLDVATASTTLEPARLTHYGSATMGSALLRKAGGTIASPTAVTNGMILGGIAALGYTSGGWSNNNSAEITFVAAEAFDSGVSGKAGASIQFVTKQIGAAAASVAMTIGADSSIFSKFIRDTAIAGTAVVVSGTGLLYKTSSSRRNKANIRQMPDKFADDFIMALVPAMYNNKDVDVEKDWVGFIAEDVEDLGGAPFVSHNLDGQVESLHYERLTVPLVVVAQKHERRIAELEAMVERLERRYPGGSQA